MARLRRFMFENVYLGEGALREQERVTGVVHRLFEHYLENPELIESPPGAPGDEALTRATDYIAGMTDRYCIRKFEELAIPREFRY
jgi:dGTPase